MKTGGRGKAGGVKLADDPADAVEKARQILGMDIKGHTVHKVLVAPARTSTRSTTSPSCSTARTAPSSRWPASRAAWTSRRWPRPSRRRSPRCRSTPTGRRRGQGPRDRRGGGLPGEVVDGVADARQALGRVRGRGRHAGRGQPAGQGPTADHRAGRQGHPRRERRLPPAGPRAFVDKAAADPLEPRPRRRTSTTSSSTARSASSATAPGW